MGSRELKVVALEIAAKMPESREEVAQIFGIIEDLLDWRGYRDREFSNFEITRDKSAGTPDNSPQ